LITYVEVSLDADLTYEQFITFLFNQDCNNGTFLLVNNGEITEAPLNFSRDLGRFFYDRGDWRSAAMYICAADLSRIVLRGRKTRETSLAGINLRGADLSSSDLSNLIFEETINIQGIPYQLRADLTGVIYDNFTIWPRGFNPPPSAD
jgi:uncharacterized protein YjbI with pentapeptide repeats